MKETETNNEISYVDVKTLYDAAFEELNKIGGQILTFQELMTNAEKLDRAYRVQLANQTSFRYGRLAA